MSAGCSLGPLPLHSTCVRYLHLSLFRSLFLLLHLPVYSLFIVFLSFISFYPSLSPLTSLPHTVSPSHSQALALLPCSSTGLLLSVELFNYSAGLWNRWRSSQVGGSGEESGSVESVLSRSLIGPASCDCDQTARHTQWEL